MVGWPGLGVPIRVRLDVPPLPFGAGARVGVLTAIQDGHSADAVLRATVPMTCPSVLCRLTR